MDNTLQPVNKIEVAINRCILADEELNRHIQEVNRADCEFKNSISALGKLITPKDAKVGEQFNICYGDRFLSVKVIGDMDFDIKWSTPLTGV